MYVWDGAFWWLVGGSLIWVMIDEWGLFILLNVVCSRELPSQLDFGHQMM